MAAYRILLLEDDAALRLVLLDALSAEGYAVTVCKSFDELAKRAGTGDCDLMLADFWGQSHRSLDARDREQIAQLGALAPVVLVTGRTWAECSTAAELGIARLLRKPFELDTLLGAIEEATLR